MISSDQAASHPFVSLSPTIAILMGTYNGAEYLVDQLNSIHAQRLNNIDIWVSDDGSTDNTINILRDYQQKWTKGRFEILQGPRKGFSHNFQSLICNENIIADYYAYADQDDVWKSDKLSRAIYHLKNNKFPSLYCSRTQLIDAEGRDLNQYSPLFSKPAFFSNALIQNIAGGNTMVLNHQARLLLVKVGIKNVVCHDWWTYILISGMGGHVYYDSYPTILYRMHDQNEIGANLGWGARFTRIKMLLKGNFKEWNILHLDALTSAGVQLTSENQYRYEAFLRARNSNLLQRMYLIKKSGVYRQTFFAQMAFYFAAMLNKI